MRVIVCGSRGWARGQTVYDRLDELPKDDLTIIQGGAKGADRFAFKWAVMENVPWEEYPAQWTKYGRSAGPRRNAEMLDAGADLVIAFRSGHHSPGTDHMVGLSRRAGVPVEVIEDADGH